MIKFLSRLFLVIFSFISIIFFHNLIVEKIIKQDILLRNQNIIEAYNAQILKKYTSLIVSLASIRKNKWQDNEQFVKFADESFEFLKTLGAIKIDLYDLYENKLISTNKSLIKINEPENKINIENLNLILDLISNNLPVEKSEKVIIIPSSSYLDSNNYSHKATLIKSTIPISSENFEVNITISIFQDITSIWNNLRKIRDSAFVAFLLIIILIYIKVNSNLQISKKIISLKQKENLRLIEMKKNSDLQNRIKTKFLINVANEFKNMTYNIITGLEIINSCVYGNINEKYQAITNDISIQCDHFLDLSQDLISYSKADIRELRPELIEIDVRKTINVCEKLIAPKAQELAIEFIKNIPNESVVILADPKRLKQAIMNILSNAFKFTPSGGKVILSLSNFVREDNVNITNIIIEDTGLGMEKDISSEFDIYSEVRLQNEGIGLGIPFSKKLVEMMNGVFTIDSKLGSGTKVTFSFYKITKDINIS